MILSTSYWLRSPMYTVPSICYHQHSAVGMLLAVMAVGAISTHHALVCLSICIAYKQTDLLSIHYAQIQFINITGMYKHVRGNPLKALITFTNVTQNENAH